MARTPKKVTDDNVRDVTMYLAFYMKDSSSDSYNSGAQAALTSYRKEHSLMIKSKNYDSPIFKSDYINALMEENFTPSDRNKVWRILESNRPDPSKTNQTKK